MAIDASKFRTIQECKGKIKEAIGNETILQLAKDHICPHYIVTNPLSGEETIFFISNELNMFLEENYLRIVKGGFKPQMTFINYRQDIFDVDVIPTELHSLSQLKKLKFEDVATPPGVYFLCLDGKIQYIGQSVNVASRVITHINEGVKEFNSVYFIHVPINDLCSVEAKLIREYNPPLNRTLNQKRKPVEVDQ